MPENQAGFRRERETMDNIYVVNYLASRNLSKKGEKLVALFVDLKAAFDTVARETLLRKMRAGKKIEKEFWTGRRVR